MADLMERSAVGAILRRRQSFDRRVTTVRVQGWPHSSPATG